MQGKYRKIEVALEQECQAYHLWKNRRENPICRIESYKEKRSIFFQVGNLLPREPYQLILMGTEEGTLCHQAFGPIYANSNGELKYYKIFEGADLEAYQYCLFCSFSEDGDTEVIYKGAVFQEQRKGALDMDKLCKKEREVVVFTPSCDETDAVWHRIEDLSHLPKAFLGCKKWMETYQHYIIGKTEDAYYLGIPGRFLQREQPLRRENIFCLWQPMRGGEAFFERPDLMTTKQQEEIFGYWIAKVDSQTESLKPF